MVSSRRFMCENIDSGSGHMPALDRLRKGQFINQTFQVQLKDPTLSAVFVQELSSLEGLHRVTLAHGEEGES